MELSLLGRSRGRKFSKTFAPGNESSRELSPPGAKVLVMYNCVTFAAWIQSRLWPAKSLTAFQSSVRTNNDGGGLAQPAQSPDTRLQAGPILAGSYPVQGGDFRYGPVCARVQRAFVLLSSPDIPRCAGPSAGVLASLQGQRTDDIAMLGRCAHLTGPAHR